ncbi:MAG: hypothetical protein IJU19_07410 [Bacteroidales bacterium]|nr:hypothetical protein [Bacteroidales bacterium]
MPRKLLIIAMMLVPVVALGQRPKARPVPTMLSVADILPNYGIDTVWVNDTAGIMRHIASQPQDDYVALTNLCVSVRTRVQQAMRSIENDYEQRDSLIWIDSATVLTDYSVYEFRLRRLAELMGRMSVKYSRMEQQRIEEEKEAARRKAAEEAQRRQEERNRMASDLRSNIAAHHRTIIAACDGAGVSDKAKLKSLKDLYYSYLMVYNKYDLSAANATAEGIARMEELYSFQTDLMEHVLGENSLPSQIDNFKNVLKVRCSDDNADIYRSYSKVFKNTAVAISFADINEYNEYINRLHTIINIQQCYLQTVDLRAAIGSGSLAIERTYTKGHKDIVSSYREAARTVNTLPSFNTRAESILFVETLEDFIKAQQRYVGAYSRIEDIERRSDSIINRAGKRSNTRDIASAYRDIKGMLIPQPSFTSSEGADRYEEQLEASHQVQQAYLQAIDMRLSIAQIEDSIYATRKVDRTLASGYRDLRKQADYSCPSFSTYEDGQRYIASLRAYIEMQRLCLTIVDKLRAIDSNRKQINTLGAPWRNIVKSYARLEKAYMAISSIGTTEDVARYGRQCEAIIAMQSAYLALLQGDLVEDTDRRLGGEDDVEKIKLIVGVR